MFVDWCMQWQINDNNLLNVKFMEGDLMDDTVAFLDNQGFTLVEVVVSMAILSIICTSFLSIFVFSYKNTIIAQDKLQALNLAQNYIEKIKTADKEELEDYTNSIYNEAKFIIKTSVALDEGKNVYVVSVDVKEQNHELIELKGYKKIE